GPTPRRAASSVRRSRRAAAALGTTFAARAPMELGQQRASGNVEDRRGIGMVGGGLGVGGVVVAVIAYFLGFDPGTAINVAQQVAPQHSSRPAAKGAPTDELGQFSAKILGSTEVVWGKILQQSNARYVPPTLVLYEGQVRSAC